ncbi:MAG: glycosyltransferase family protein [Bacteroidales bacterium]
MEKTRVIFTVQGEGHGHMTQARRALSILKKHNFELCAVFLGRNNNTLIPEHFQNEMNCEIIPIRSLELISSRDHRHNHILTSILGNMYRFSPLMETIKKLDKGIKKYKPDLILNFYEPLMGLYNFFYSNKIPVISLGHQFLFVHPDFPVKTESKVNKKFLDLATNIVGIKSKKKLALSFYPLKDAEKKNLFVIPPLINTDILESLNIEPNNHYTVYLNRPGFLDTIKKWQKENDHIQFFCFTNLPEIKELTEIQPNFYLHPLDQKSFINKVASGYGLITTAGFESVCEAAYIGKPVLMLPMHIEQEINGADAHYFGIGIVQREPEIESFKKFISNEDKFKITSDKFKEWMASAEQKFISEIQSVISN